MTNKICKRRCKRADFARFSASNMVAKYLKLLAIPAGFEPATIGLEGPKPSPEICGFARIGLQLQTAFPLRKLGWM